MPAPEHEAEGPSEAAPAKGAESSPSAGQVGNRALGALLARDDLPYAQLARRVGNRALGGLIAQRRLARSPLDFDEGDEFGARPRRGRPRFSGSTEDLHADVYGDSSLAHAPTGPQLPRTETTAFGTWRVVADSTPAPLAADQIKQSDFLRLERAWTRVNDGTGGLTTNGSATDKAALFAMFGREMARSKTFRDVIIEITEDRTHPVTINVGRNNAYWVDEFATNNVDLDDLEWFETGPVANYTWVQTQGEIILHWLVERRFAAVNGGGFAAAHAHPMAAGGRQEKYRGDLGQAGRVVSQTRTDLGGGLQEGRYTDTAGNMTLIRRDASAGHPVVYEMEYRPAAPTAASPGRTRTSEMVAEVRSTASAIAALGAPADELYVRFAGATRAASTPPQPVLAGGRATFRLALGQIVPVGGPITVEVWRKPATGADVRLLTLAWAHPFSAASSPAAAAGPVEAGVRLETR